MKKCLLLLISMLFGALLLSHAQGLEDGENRFTGAVVDSLTNEPLPGAIITVINLDGSSLHVADAEGKFDFIRLQNGMVRIEVTMLGYHIVRKTFDTDEEYAIDAGTFRLSPDPEELDASIVKGRSVLFKQSGDTTLFFVSSLLLGRPVSALEALNEMPGVKATQDGVSVNGKTVERTYVNGKLIFGKDDPLAALNNIDAQDVAAILAYDEFDEEAQALARQGDGKRKVLNVVTFDFFNQSVVFQGMASGGADTQKNMDGKFQPRYLAGMGAHFYSEQRQFLLDYVGNNVGRSDYMVYKPVLMLDRSQPASYNRDHRLVVKYADIIRKSWNISGIYEFDHLLSRDREIRSTDYFQTASTPARMYSDRSMLSKVGQKHDVDLELEHVGEKSSLRAGAHAQWRSSEGDDRNVTELSSEEVLLSNTSVRNRQQNWQRNFSADFRYSHRVKTGSVGMDLDGRWGRNELDKEHRQDSVERDFSKILLTEGDGNNHRVSSELHYTHRLHENSDLSFSYRLENDYQKRHHLVYDEMTQEMDRTLSREYTDHSLQHSGQVSYSFFNNNWRLNASLEYRYKKILRNDFMSADAAGDKIYHTISPNILLSYTVDYRSGFNFSYRLYDHTPSLEQLAAHLDYTNPMYLQAGNPDLEQGRLHHFDLDVYHRDMENQRYFSFRVAYQYGRNEIGAKSIYFNQATYLPQYDFTAPAGANLTTWKNLDGSHDFSTHFRVESPLPFIRCNGGISLGYSYQQQPMYVGEELTDRVCHAPGLYLDLRSNFSKWVKIQLEDRLNWRHNKVIGGLAYSSLSHQLNASLKTDFAKRAYFDVSYSLLNDWHLDNQEVLFQVHQLGMELGWRLFKSKKGRISLSVHDLINQNQVFSQQILADRAESVWCDRMPRYVMLNFVYKFQRNR